jgi:hypothetical protein
VLLVVAEELSINSERGAVFLPGGCYGLEKSTLIFCLCVMKLMLI